MSADLDDRKLENYIPPAPEARQVIAETIVLGGEVVRGQVFDVRGQILGEFEELAEK